MAKVIYKEDFEDFGRVEYVRSVKAKHLNLSVRGSLVRVAVPKRVTIYDAKGFVNRNLEWIKRQVEKKQMPYAITNKIDKKAAKVELSERIQQLSDNICLPFKKVHVKSQKTLWGSCSKENNINLNIKLVLLPIEVGNYVIIHELVHTKVKNHGLDFWQEVGKHCPNFKEYRRKLRNYQSLLYY